MEQISNMIDAEDSQTSAKCLGMNMIGNRAEGSSLSSSTSSLVSSNSVNTTPLVFAPPSTPLQQVQQLTSPTFSTSISTFPTVNAGPVLSSTSSAAICANTIPFYQLNNNNTGSLPLHQHLASTSNSFAENDGSVMLTRLDGFKECGSTSTANGLLSTVESRLFSNRRECKSTSDESYTLELEEQSLIASAANKIEFEKISKATKTSEESHIDNRDLLSSSTSSIFRLSCGQFGFNPVSLGILSSSTFPTRFNRYSGFGRCVQTREKNGIGHFGTNKKCPKRLSGQNKLFIENLKKTNSNDYAKNKKLFFAVSNNDIQTVNELVKSNIYDLNCTDDKQRTCLHLASSRGNIDLVRLLLEHGANPNIRDCVNNLPIHLAIISSHVQVVTLLLEAGTHINSLDLNGKSVLHLAGTRLRWLLSDENQKASPKLKFEAIMIMNMIKEFLRRKKTPSTNDLDTLALQLEKSINFDDINCITKQMLSQFESLNI